MSKRVVTLSKAIDRFLTEFEDAEGAAQSTLDSYRWTLNKMGDRLGWDVNPLTVTYDDLIDVLGTWRKLSPSSRANRISVMRTFFAFLAKRYRIENPAAELARPRKDKPARKRLTQDDVQHMLEACDTDRDRLVIYLLSHTGIRRSDLLKLRWRDVDFASRVIVIRLGKGRKGREIPMPVALADVLADIAARMQERGDYRPDYFVAPFTIDHPTPTGGRAFRIDPRKPMSASQPYKIVARVAAKADVPPPCSPHDLRRYYADVFLAANPGDIVHLQAVMGHADIGTTRIYLKDAELPKVKAAVDRIEFGSPAPEKAPDVIPEEAQ